MTTTTASYDQPAVWAPLLVEWARLQVEYFGVLATIQRDAGNQFNAGAYDDLADEYRNVAARAAALMTTDDAEQLAAIQADDEPPSTLVALTGWLWGRWHRSFPWVNTTTWQQIGYLLMRGRP